MSLKLDYFSKVGKISHEKYSLKSTKSKNHLGKDIFIPDKNWQINDYLSDNTQIQKETNFNIDEIRKSIKLNHIKKKIGKENNIKNIKENQKDEKDSDIIFKKIFQGFKYKYHNIHVSKVKKFKEKGLFTKINIQQESLYHPKYEYLYQKIITGPKWSNLTYRKKNLFNEQNYITNLSYNSPQSINDNIKGFVDMSKQTKRKGFIEEKNHNKKNNFNFRTSLNFKPKHPFLIMFSNSNEGIINNNESENFIFNNESNEVGENKENIKNISGPDFNRYLSRDHLNNVFRKNERIINGDLSPNYNCVESGTKMMVFYKKSRNHKLKDNRSLNIMDTNIIFDASKTFDKIYGNKYKVVPNFEKMTPRKNNKLPFFFNGLTNRNIYSMSTDKSLKMNNFSNSKIYNLCGDMKTNLNKYKNNKLANMRKYFSFDNIQKYNKKKVLRELKDKIKKFNRLVVNCENINNNNF